MKSQTGGSTQTANKNNVFFAPIIHENTLSRSRLVVKINIFTILAAGCFTITTSYANAKCSNRQLYFVSSKHSVPLHSQKAHNNNTIIDKTRPSCGWKLCCASYHQSRTNELKI